MIDAEFRSEERFSRLSIAYDSDTEKTNVCSCIDSIVDKYEKKPEIYTTKVSNDKEVLVIEYHDDNDRESGAIFEEIMKTLEINKCS